MKSSEEMMKSLYERREQYIAAQRAKHRADMKIASSLFCACLVVLLGVGVWQSGMLDTAIVRMENISPIALTENHSEDPGNMEPGNVVSSGEERNNQDPDGIDSEMSSLR